MKTLLTFTLTPTEPMVTILAGTLIIAGVALLVTYILLHQVRTEREQAIRDAMMWTDEASKLKKELDSMRSERNAIEDELTAAKSDVERERVLRKKIFESRDYWKAKAEQAFKDIDQWKALYIEHLNRANRFEELHNRMTKRPRDPKTGQFVKPTWVSDESRNNAAMALEQDMKSAMPEKHTLRHGMTVKDPTPEQAKEIFDEAKRLGIDNHGTVFNPRLNCINYYESGLSGNTIGTCADYFLPHTKFITPEQFLAHMRGEA
jgi:hypothetical protein